MTTFQLDQCLNSKKFVQACNAQGLCAVHRFPSDLHGLDDSNVLTRLLSTDKPLLTTDSRMALDHASAIPLMSSGLVVIHNDKDVRTMTISIAQQVLREFKSAFPEWHTVSWRNSVVTVSSKNIEVSHAIGNTLVRDLFAEFAEPNWQSRVKAVLSQNSLGVGNS